ncbi:MAG TPA: hypothetical protein VFF98_15920 [Novosphingobium sp.]|nr:hypothetical protein [Novosphingobium sp.]HZV10795.1 hypothetical protein [Novosphingobium sp.]
MNAAAPALPRDIALAAFIGAQDAARCGCREPAAPREELGWSSRLLLWLLGDNRPRPLANPRLEAVRRFACATRAGHKPGIALVSELHNLGLQPAHLALLSEFML